MQLLSINEIRLKLNENWEISTSHLKRTIVFSTFKEVIQFINAVADVAEAMNHHPEWCNVYTKIEIVLTTHDAKGVTQKDIDLATKIDEIAKCK